VTAPRDPFTAEVVKGALASLADEMAVSVLRTAHSEVIRDTMDFSTAIFDGRGQLVAQGLTLALHLGAMPDALAAVRAKFAGDVYPEDVFVLNDPDEGGMHLPDVFVFTPVFDGERLYAWTGCVAHHVDMGGRAAGSNAVDSWEIFQEGLQIPALKLHDRGRVNETLIEILRKNVRPPEVVLGDLRAQLAACHFATRGLERLAARYGLEVVARLMDEVLDHAERVARAELAAVPDGVYRFRDRIDDDGFGSGPIEIAAEVSVRGDEVVVDLTGSSLQVDSALNSTASFTRAAVYTALLAALGSAELGSNAGFYRPVTVVVPEGTILNARRPAARAARALTGFRVIDTVLGALHEALPERVPAAGEGGVTMISFGSRGPDGGSGVYVEFVSGSWGAGPHGDGLDGTSPLGGNCSNVPVEMLELHHPIRVERYGFVPSTGGPGRYRGGLSIERELRFLGERGMLQVRSDRRRFPPYGLAGGLPGAPSENVLNPGTPDEEALPSKFSRPIQRGDVFRHVTAGGGGYGDRSERDPERVRADLDDEKIDAAHARDAYGFGAGRLNPVGNGGLGLTPGRPSTRR
jgi:N-methylhydantoinase B